MRLLMPSHARKVKQYADAVPLFQRAGVEDQLSAMYNPVVQLKSGGYLVINPTEALVSIDINSGRSTREHNIEQTATATNLEAAHEIARQLRLRDMAGLVVIDFIDMDHSSNVRKVEKAMKEALKNDRARIQVGRISAFGLMEMSRQRLRTGVLEASTVQCPHCEGTGLVRTASSAGLSALRMIEDEAARGRGSVITLRASQEAAFYVLNKKRADIAEIEDRYGVTVEILSDGELEGARMSVECSGPPPAHAPRFEKLVEEPEDDDYVEEIDEEEEELEEEAEASGGRREGRGERRERDEGEGNKRRRRRRGRGRGRREEGEGAEGEAEAEAGDDADVVEAEAEGEREEAAGAEGEGRENGRKRRRRGRRGGRRGDRAENGAEGGEDAAEGDAPVSDVAEMAEAPAEAAPVAEEAPAKPKRTRKKKAEAVEAEAAPAVEAPVEVVAEPIAEEAPAKPKRTRKKKVDAEAAPEAPAVEAAPEPVVEAAAEAAPAKPKRTRKKAVTTEAAPAPAVEAAPVAAEAAPEGAAEAGEGEGDEGGEGTRRGWWQRTFG
jgi:ribonuclease E